VREVLARLRRPLDQWKHGEIFDVTGFADAVGMRINGWQNVLFLRADGLSVLRRWEDDSDAGLPFIALYGAPGIGKSTLLQLAALRALVRGESVFVYMKGSSVMLSMVDCNASLKEARWVVNSVTKEEFSTGGRYVLGDTVLCFDSQESFNTPFGEANVWKKVFAVFSSSAAVDRASKTTGLRWRLFANPLEDELIAVGALAGVSANGKVVGIDADEVRRRIGLYGHSIRYVCDANVAETQVKAGIVALIALGVKGLSDPAASSHPVHRITAIVLDSNGDDMLVFLSDNIRDQVVRRMAARHAAGLLRLANTVDIHGSLRGQIFENRMLDVLGRAGATVEVKTGSGTKVLQIARAGIALSLDRKKGYSLPDGTVAVSPGTLYVPPHSNNESWDAIFVESLTTAYLLQMTVASAHSVKHNGIVAGTEFLKRNGFTIKKGKNGNVHIAFLVPPAVFRDFQVPQAMLDSRKQLCAKSTSDGWPQAKWCVDKLDGGAFWPPT
jgi:hypothetical protein